MAKHKKQQTPPKIQLEVKVQNKANALDQHVPAQSVLQNHQSNIAIQEVGIRTQRYALKAYPKVESKKDKDIEAKYRTIALNFPTLVLQGGLAQAIGFLLAKAGEKTEGEHQNYLNDLAEILGVNEKNNKSKAMILHDLVRESDIAGYQILTRQTLEASAWLKRYTQSLLKRAT